MGTNLDHLSLQALVDLQSDYRHKLELASNTLDLVNKSIESRCPVKRGSIIQAHGRQLFVSEIEWDHYEKNWRLIGVIATKDGHVRHYGPRGGTATGAIWLKPDEDFEVLAPPPKSFRPADQ